MITMFKSLSELCDVVSVIIHCNTDGTVLLILEQGGSEYWIPTVKVEESSSWLTELSSNVLQEIFGNQQPTVTKMLHLYKTWVPHRKLSYVCRSIFQVDINGDMKKRSRTATGKYRNKIRWVDEEDITKLTQSGMVKSPEIVDLFLTMRSKKSLISHVPIEHLTGGNITEITNNVLLSNKNSVHDQLVEASKINKADQESIYEEYLVWTYPSIYLNAQSFYKFCQQIGWSKDELPHLFRSADLNQRGGLSFKEFLYFLAATEPATNHGGPVAELRCKYIFRYLDINKSNVLKREEMRRFIFLVRKGRKQPIEAHKIEKDLADSYRAMGITEATPIGMTEFLKAVGDLKLRGTSHIYRAPNSIHKYLKECSGKKERLSRLSDTSIFACGKSTASYTRGQPYEIAVHSIKIQRTGATINVEQLWNIDSATSMMSSMPKPVSELSRKVSKDQFDQNSKSNELLKAVRYLTTVNQKMNYYGKPEGLVFTWGQLNSSTVATNIIAVCMEVKQVLVKEPRLLNVPSPVYILGDLHGNFAALLNFERVFWHVGPGLCPCNLLFLGDYVDRGLFSFEIVCYLFCYKLQSPNKVFLLRGNHEIRRVQQQWTFERECKLKFGDKTGADVFSAINDAFDTMPLAAVVDGRVFCCHGGIPPPWLCPVAAAINDVPAVLNDPQEQSCLAWELMWNDPIRSKTINEKVTMEMLANEGFALNHRRGTAHLFSVEALEKFLNANGFSHLVRAHEVVEAGFYLQQRAHALTVFSASKYCGGQNMAACILADKGKLRILRLESE